ncbi:LysR family transcriptional regulator [Aureimonas sp. SA4125]|uniref:LysR substrate-binding domain-containing protein n=1 Tax=Aureimonas sp. SA4125 TaxID=2826993 RepID=UPI001CC679D3|nr:LysR substrate-binding domain-containing protein [Aureimonas sp. SA4125]BDA85790.1 LysR family transcriptional regulator [Aureimonas sp. SA4125]
MSRNLPPLAAVRVFEAAARHGNFTRAASELGMTQASVSYQIKILEERVGAPLFVRRPRDVVLTGAGHLLAQAAGEALDQLAAAFADAKGQTSGVLSLSVFQTFASAWLVERIGGFQVEHPGLAVRLDTSVAVVDLAREDVDIAVRAGKGDWPGLTCHLLVPGQFTPMMSPALAARLDRDAGPGDLLRLPLISPAYRWWDSWFAAAGVSRPHADSGIASDLGAQDLEARVALAGQGVAMLNPIFFAAELASGDLVQPFDLVCKDSHDYWLCYRTARRTVPKIQAFRNWILREIAAAPES